MSYLGGEWPELGREPQVTSLWSITASWHCPRTWSKSKMSPTKAGSKFGFGNGESVLDITEKSMTLAHKSEVTMTWERPDHYHKLHIWLVKICPCSRMSSPWPPSVMNGSHFCRIKGLAGLRKDSTLVFRSSEISPSSAALGLWNLETVTWLAEFPFPNLKNLGCKISPTGGERLPHEKVCGTY